MYIRDITENKVELAEGEFIVFGDRRKWYLSDSTGKLAFLADNFDTLAGQYSPRIGDVVEASVVIEYCGDEVQEVVGRVAPLDLPREPLMCLMHPIVTYPELAQELTGYIRDMKSRPLRQFITNLLNEEEIALGLMRARASKSHHHNESGGLLRHVVEMARAALTQQFIPAPSDYERELLLTAVLVHDIGKVSAGFLSKRRGPRPSLNHKERGKLLIKRPLEWLADESPATARDLRAVVKDILGSHRVYQTKVGLLLQILDQGSAFADASEQTFDGLPQSTRLAHLGGVPGLGRTYYRVSHLHVV